MTADPWAWLAAASAGGATVLLLAPRLPPSPTSSGDTGAEGRRGRHRAGPLGVVLLGAAVLGAAAVGSPRVVVLAALAAASGWGVARLVSGRRRMREVVAVRHRVVELCAGLRAELVAGAAPSAALQRAADDWPAVAPAARAATAGGDVPEALRSLAERPGAEALCFVAAAWQVSHRTGHGLAATLGRVAEDLRAAEGTRRVVAGELASARATARLLALLPVFALVVGSGAGAAPVDFLVEEPVGIACLAAGLALTGLGLAWIDGLARAVEAAS